MHATFPPALPAVEPSHIVPSLTTALARHEPHDARNRRVVRVELRRRLHLDGDRVGAGCECEARRAVRAVQDVDGVRGGARVAQGGAGVEATLVVSVCS